MKSLHLSEVTWIAGKLELAGRSNVVLGAVSIGDKSTYVTEFGPSSLPPAHSVIEE